jgi:hypothetical protein
MKRFRCWLFNGLAALSLLLCLATAGMWARSYWRADGSEYCSARLGADQYARDWSFASAEGRLGVVSGWWRHSGYWADPPFGFRARSSAEASQLINTLEQSCQAQGGRHFPGIFISPQGTILGSVRTDGPRYVNDVVISYWLPALALAILPVIKCRNVRRQRRSKRRRSRGLCPNCGYDVRATSGRCPECGTSVPAESGA